jgi:hypothetical protein
VRGLRGNSALFDQWIDIIRFLQVVVRDLVQVQLLKRVIEVLIADSIVNSVHLIIFIKEVLVFSALEDSQTPRLSSLNIISH